MAWALLAGWSGSATGQALSSAEPGAFSLRGFGTVGFARSSSQDARFLRDVSHQRGVGPSGSAEADTIGGLQANFRVNDEMELVAQVVSHLRYDNSFSPELTWAFAKFDPLPRVSVRLGRIGTEFLMQSDSRMVGYSYLPVRPNADYFGGVPINYGDGADVQVRWPLGDGVLRASAFAGAARERLTTYETNGSPIRSGSLGFDQGSWQLRYIHAQSRLTNSVPRLVDLLDVLNANGAANAARTLDLAGNQSVYRSLGVTYDDGTWQAQAATNTINHQSAMLENSTASYLLVGRRFENVSPYLGYSLARSTPRMLETGLPPAYFGPVIASIADITSRSHLDGRTTTLGARWDFRRGMDLKFQVDFLRGGATPTQLLVNSTTPAWNGRTTVLSMALDFVF